MKKKYLILLLTAVFAAGGVAPAQAASKYSLSVSVWVDAAGVGDTKTEALERCAARGSGKIGSKLTVRNSSNRILAVKEMVWRLGEVRQRFRPTDINDPLYVEGTVPGSEYFIVACGLQAKIKVPKSSFYQLTVGSVSAGEYSFRELRSNKWKLVLSY